MVGLIGIIPIFILNPITQARSFTEQFPIAFWLALILTAIPFLFWLIIITSFENYVLSSPEK